MSEQETQAVEFPSLEGINGIQIVTAKPGPGGDWEVQAVVDGREIAFGVSRELTQDPNAATIIADYARTQSALAQESQPADDAELQELQQAVQEAGLEGATKAADADAAAPTVIAVAHLHAAQALPEVGPDADVVPGCVYEGIELFKAEDRRTMRVVLVRDLGLAAQEVPEQPAEEA